MKSVVIVVVSFLFVLVNPAAAQEEYSARARYITNIFVNPVYVDTVGLLQTDQHVDTTQIWRQWVTVSNYQFGKNRGSLPMIADLKALHPYFRDKVIELIGTCKSMGITLAVVESYRTRAKQAEYYAMGAQYTSTPGGKSRHQYGLAVDVVPVVDSVAVWNNQRLWKKIGVAGERLGLRWGGRWRVLYDPGHFEWSGGVSRNELADGALPRIPHAVVDRYPSLDAELNTLQTFWQAWEVEQSVMANRGMEAPAEAVGIGQ